MAVVELLRTAQSWIQKTPGKCGGDACIRDTRVPVWSVIEASQKGSDDEALQTYFVTPLTVADIQAAHTYYLQNKLEIDTDIRLNHEA